MSNVGPILIRLLAAVLAILIPFPIARYFHRRHGIPWSLFRWGCLTFVVSQVFHIPFNVLVLKMIGLQGDLPRGASLIYLAIFAGLSAGIFEETTRYLAYRYKLTTPADRTFKSALMFGVGHGGIESILLAGVSGIAQLIVMTVLKDSDLESKGVPADQVELLQKQIAEYWAVPWYGVLMVDLERIFAITMHIAMTVLVLQTFRRRGGVRWLIAAILWHAGLDFSAVVLTTLHNIYIAELVLGLWALASYGIIHYFSEHDNEADGDVYTEISNDAGAPFDPTVNSATLESTMETERQRLAEGVNS